MTVVCRAKCDFNVLYLYRVGIVSLKASLPIVRPREAFLADVGPRRSQRSGKLRHSKEREVRLGRVSGSR